MLSDVKNFYWKERRGNVLLFSNLFLAFLYLEEEQTCIIFVLEMIGDDVESEFSSFFYFSNFPGATGFSFH